MNDSEGAWAVLRLLAALFLGLTSVWYTAKLWAFFLRAEKVRNSLTPLERRLTWLCLITQWAPALPRPFARLGRYWAIKAAREIRPWTKGGSLVAVRFDPTSPTRRKYRVRYE